MKETAKKIFKSKKFWFGLLVVVLLGFLFYYFNLQDWLYQLQESFKEFVRTDLKPWLDNHPILAPFTYMAFYIVSVIAFMPGSVVTLVGGAVFGWLWGFIYTSIASTIAAGCAFLIARYVARDWVEQRVGERVEALQEGVRKEGWRIIAVTRLIPLFPFNMLNYMFGLTRISFWKYVGLSWLCMIPGTFAYVYLGHAVGVTLKGGEGQSIKKTVFLLTSAIGLLVLVSMIPRWLRKKEDDGVIEELEEVAEDESSNSGANEEKSDTSDTSVDPS